MEVLIAQPKGITNDEYLKQFVVKKNDIPKIEGKPIYTAVKPVRDAIEINLLNLADSRDPILGELHLIQNTMN